jgi:hypothetical protein
MATKTSIANMAMTRLGESVFKDVDTDGTNPADAVNAIWDIILEQALYQGPEEGWRFARRRYHGIDRESFTITAFAQASSTTTTVTAKHTLLAGDKVEISGTTSYDGTYDVVSVTGTTSFVITKTFVADDATGTVKWTSKELAYRYARPTCTRVTNVQTGGIEIKDWVREGDFILTNMVDDEVDMLRVLAPSEVVITNFPMHFVEVLWRRLAIHLTYSLVQNENIRTNLLSETEQIFLPRAIGMDNREQYVQESSSAWEDVGRKTSILE